MGGRERMILNRVELAKQHRKRNDMSAAVTFEPTPKKSRKKLVISSVVGGVILIIGVGACGGVQSGTATTAGTAASASTAPTTADKKITVPVLTGLTVKQATTKLTASGLSIAVTGDTSDPKFVVLSQSTATGDPKEGNTVTVVIGESAPQKTAREAAEAQAALAAQKKPNGKQPHRQRLKPQQRPQQTQISPPTRTSTTAPGSWSPRIPIHT